MKKEKTQWSVASKMTAKGELYVDEACRDEFADILDKWFGKDTWSLDGSPYQIWDLSEMPDKIDVVVRDQDNREKILGVVRIKNNFFIDEGMCGKYIDIEPDDIELISKE